MKFRAPSAKAAELNYTMEWKDRKSGKILSRKKAKIEIQVDENSNEVDIEYTIVNPRLCAKDKVGSPPV